MLIYAFTSLYILLQPYVICLHITPIYLFLPITFIPSFRCIRHFLRHMPHFLAPAVQTPPTTG